MKIARLFNVDIRVHMSLPIMLIFFTGMAFLAGEPPLKALEFPIVMTTLLTLVTVHEFAHIFVARRYGVDTKTIVLSPIGGMAMIEKVPDNPKGEIYMSLAGPASNLVMAIPFWLMAKAGVPFADKVLLYNLTIALFNLIPLFPMDGGRVLRGFLDIRMMRTEATWISCRVSQALGILVAFVGIFYVHNFMYAVIAAIMAFMSQVEASNTKNVTRDDLAAEAAERAYEY